MIKMSKYYDSIAEGYDELYGEEQKKKMDIVKANIEIKPDTKILDIGCGSGISSDFDCICVGIDPSKKLIEKAIEYNKKRNEKIKKNLFFLKTIKKLSFCDYFIFKFFCL